MVTLYVQWDIVGDVYVPIWSCIDYRDKVMIGNLSKAQSESTLGKMSLWLLAQNVLDPFTQQILCFEKEIKEMWKWIIYAKCLGIIKRIHLESSNDKVTYVCKKDKFVKS